MSTKTGAYTPNNAQNPLSDSSLEQNGDAKNPHPNYPDYAGGMKPLGSKDMTGDYIEK